MRERLQTDRPRPWIEERQAASSPWSIPFRRINWSLAWVSWALSHWALLDVLEHLETFSVLVAVVFYFADSGNRVKQKHYQAWQVINTAQGKGGSGGRIEALQELNCRSCFADRRGCRRRIPARASNWSARTWSAPICTPRICAAAILSFRGFRTATCKARTFARPT